MSSSEEVGSEQAEKAAKFRKLNLIIHPFLFAVLPIFFLLSFTKDEILLEETLPALFGLEILACATLLVAFAIWRDWCKAAIGTTLFIVLLCTYRVWQVYIDMTFTYASAHPYIPLISFFVICGFTIFFVLKGKFNFGPVNIVLDYRSLNSALNVVSAALVLINGLPIVSYELEMQDKVEAEIAELAKPFAGVALDKNAAKPDVYYIILDGFASPYTFDQFWHLRDSSFLDYLKQNDFYVVPKALSNYDRTELSICSSLNMSYIGDVEARSQAKSHQEAPGLVFMRLIQDSTTVRFFKQLGYKFVAVSSGSFGTDHVLTADKVVKANSINHFARAMAYITPWWSLESYFPVLRDAYCQTRLTAGDKLDQITSTTSPKFVFIHTELPHAPILFDANGNKLKLPPGLLPVWDPADKLFGQWQYTTKQVEDWITRIKKATGGKAIIIVQSDHGSGIVMKKPIDWYNERMHIVNAYYFPGTKSELYATVTPVNTFRILFRDYFKANLPLLKDQSLCSPDWTKPFAYHDVTSEVSFPPEAK
jgi:hypothetical protein